MEEENTKFDVGTRLRRLLMLRRENLVGFAERAGIPYRTFQNYVAGKIKPNADQLARISLAGIDVNFLLTGKYLEASPAITTDELGDSEEYYLLADTEVVKAIDAKARQCINLYIDECLLISGSVRFEDLLDKYKYVLKRLLTIFVKANPPILEARRHGMSVDGIINSTLDMAASFLAMEIAKQAAEMNSQGSPPPEL